MIKQFKMAIPIYLLTLLIATTSSEPSRWSRQISSYTSDISDWVPLTRPIERPDQPIKRQAIAQPRILSEPFSGFSRPTGFSQEFPNSGFFQSSQQRPLYLQSVPTASQNFLNDQGFGQQGLKLTLGMPSFPLNQGFVSNQGFNRFPQNPVNQFPKPVPQVQPKFPQFQSKPVSQIATQPRQEAPKFMDGYKLENASSIGKPKPQSLQKIKFDNTKQFGSFQKPPPNPQRPGNVEREEVQLLYVPVDSLNRGFQSSYKTIPSQTGNRDSFGSSAVPRPDTISQFPKPQRSQQSFQSDYYNSFNGQNFGVPQPSQIFTTFGTTPSSPFPTIATTPKPKKLKPHQPPLAVFLAHENTKPGNVKVADVLTTLKTAKNIAVLDSVTPGASPKVFIGPSTLLAPEKYVKFELPYLSNLENTDKKLRQLPFFVAPLSYNTPEGFAKIPFPSPHVGSVIVNGLLKDSNPQTPSTPNADVIPNAYTPDYSKQTQFNPATTKPTVSYFSTSSPTLSTQPQRFQDNSFSFEPQSVSSIKPTEREPNIITAPAPPQNSQFFQYNKSPPLFKPQTKLQPGQIEASFAQRDRFQNNQNYLQNQTPPPTTRLTSKTPSTFPNVLLETHNPFSINQAFDFSSPLDYHANIDEGKRDFSTPTFGSQTPRIQPEVSTESEVRPSSPNYLQNYNPEIHYQSEILSSRFPNFDADSYRTTQSPSPSSQTPESQSQSQDFSQDNAQDQTPAPNPEYIQTSRAPSEYATGPSSFDESNKITPSKDAEQYTTTTRRPIRGRGKPRSTTPRTDSDVPTRPPVTRKPLRERRPLPTRTRPTTERTTPSRRQPESNTNAATESSVYKTTKLRTRGRHQYKSTENPDESHNSNKHSKNRFSAEDDIAYQRDVLHQNYPVTLQERTSTTDSDSVTSPAPRISSTRQLQTESPSEESYITEQPIRHNFEGSSTSEPQVYTSRSAETESPYVPKFSASINEEPSYSVKSSTRQYEESDYEKPSSQKYDPNLFVSRSSSSTARPDSEETVTATEPIRSSTYSSKYTDFDLRDRQRQPEEEVTTVSNNYEASKVGSNVQLSEDNSLSEERPVQQEEINTVPPTTPNRPKIRPRPLPHRQQTPSTEPTSTEPSRKPVRVDVKRRPINAVTYKPAFNRRTTMKIEEIEAELKTKPVNSRFDNSDRHPVYRPEPSTEPAATTPITPKKPTQYRRRRPQSSFSSTTTSENLTSSKKPTFDTKNRFRGRRPTTERAVQIQQEETTATTTQKPQFNRLNQRSRISERFNLKKTTKAPIAEEQDADSSIHRPKIVPYEEKIDENWSPDSFKPFNPNDITEQAVSEYRNKQITANEEEPEIVTARDYDEILLTVTPASNNANKNVPEVIPTLEAMVENQQNNKGSIESVIEQMMKSLEEQDEDEYTRNVMKHEHGEIGEIPPERVIDSSEGVQAEKRQYVEPVTAAFVPESPQNNQETGERKTKRRGYWKKVRVRPVTTESFEVAESQFYTKTINHLDEEVKPTKTIPQETTEESQESVEIAELTTVLPDIPEAISIPKDQEFSDAKEDETTKVDRQDETTTENVNPGDMDLGTGAPNAMIEDYATTTETNNGLSMFGNAGGSIMDYLFGFSSENQDSTENGNANSTTEKSVKESTTESSFIPAEITEQSDDIDETSIVENFESVKEVKTEKSTVTEVHKNHKHSEITTQKSAEIDRTPAPEISTSSEASWDSSGMVTSMSTEISHETEICYRGKCIKTTKDFV